MAFEDLNDFFDDSLRLPVGGKMYVIPGPDADLGLYVQTLMTAGYAAIAGRQPGVSVELSDDEEVKLYDRILGPAMAELRADGVSWPKIQHVAQTALMWIGMGTAAAEQYWAAGPKAPETPAPNRATRRRSTRTGAATATPSRASTSGTRSRKASSTS